MQLSIPRVQRTTPAVLVLVLALSVAACASFQAAPLATAVDLQPTRTEDASARWTVADVVARALRDNRDLLALRAQRRVASAQRLGAGLLPDPSFNGALLPLLAGPGTTLAWNAALSEDLRALVTLRARQDGAKSAALEVDAQILWQEWQTAAQARLLAVQLIEGERMLALQAQSRDLFLERSDRLQAALASGDAALSTVAPDLAALQAARALADTTLRLQLARRHQLNAILNRAPDAPLPLVAVADMPAIDLGDKDLQEIARRRPDLIALRLGYRSQEARVRLAILMQFPALNIGVAGGSDNSNVRNAGPQVAASLPLFDRNRGDVALQEATRTQLQAEYQARLDAAYGQLKASTSELAAAQAAVAIVREDLPAAEHAAQSAARALGSGDLDELAYVDLASAYYAKRLEVAALEETILEQRLTIAAITGSGLPAVSTLRDAAF